MQPPDWEYDVSLRPYNSFGIPARASMFTVIRAEDQLPRVLHAAGDMPRLILGGGSNILFTRDFEGLVVKVEIPGIDKVREDGEHIWLRAGAGQGWHELVMFTVGKGWGGIENLALIPGQAGTAPIQNIGAYGVELADVLEEVRYYDTTRKEFLTLLAGECGLGYRDSVFKRELKCRAVISSITLRLARRPEPVTHYGAIASELASMGITQPGPSDIADAVIRIRRSKLPDPLVLGNAGSFFKNPVIDEAQAAALAAEFPGMPSYPAGEGRVKLAAGWLIERAGWKGHRTGDAGVHERQALVLVNHGRASGRDILRLAEDIRSDIHDKFGILLETEVNIL